MQPEQLDLTPLKNSIDRLKEGWDRYQEDASDTRIRDGLIQRFEFTYEISHKMLKRFLKVSSPSPTEFDQMTFQDLIRTGNEQNLLLGNWPQWREYRAMRGRTSHTYNEDVSLEVVAEIPAFQKEAEYLYQKLQDAQK